jgi:hypothetical protein
MKESIDGRSLQNSIVRAATICFVLGVLGMSAMGQIPIGGGKVIDFKKPEVKKPTSPNDAPGNTNQSSGAAATNANGSGGITSAGPSRQVVEAFRTDAQPYSQGIHGLSDMQDHIGKDWSPLESVDSIRKYLEQAAALAAIIQQKYPNIENPDWSRNWEEMVGDWRHLAEDREQVVKAYLSDKVGAPLREKAKELDKARARVAGGFDFELPYDFDEREKAHAEVVKLFSSRFALVGMTMPDNSVFAGYDTALDALIAEEKKRAGEWGWDATLHDPVIEAKVRAWMPRLGANTQVVKIGLRDTTWQVNKNSIGIPEGRYRRGLVMYRKPGADLCVVAKFSFEQNYEGGGRYSAMANTSGFTYLVRLQTCK